ncbi:hypothetical protein SAY87_022135 [Trapa incisa]|uniref:GBF-interacting protein 1 N-terminal domain-containing protein n=1 Tax=Trapa incisa TaxID=236973 RepID=A0AAN7JUA3_9MYRT|nr:hypothetical protein SAY87_022135 [Trapa incisa]
MSNSGGNARVSIPDNLRKMLDNIREISGKQHADEDVYAMLRECAFDPNETVQKLFYLETFQEVKSRRDKRKDSANSKVPETKLSSETHVRGSRGNRNPSSSQASSGGPKHVPSQREKKTSNFTERSSGTTPLPLQKTKDDAGSHVIKATDTVTNGPPILYNGISTHAPTPETSVDDVISVFEASSSEVSSTLDHLIALPLPRQSGSGAVKHETGLKRMPSANYVYKKKVPSKSEAVEKVQISHPSQSSSILSEEQPMTIKPSPEKVDGTMQEASIPLEVVISKVASVTVPAGSQSLSSSNVSWSQQVTFPNHFQVSEAFKNALTFGSFDANFGVESETKNPVGTDNSDFIAESSQGSDENVDESSSRHEEVLPSAEKKLLDSLESTNEKPKQDTLLLPEDPPNPIVQDASGNNFDFISPILTNPNAMHSEGPEPRAQDISHPPYFSNGNSPTLSSPSPTPTPVAQGSVSVSPQQVPVFRHPYPLNYFPYGHYLAPFYMPPIHQLLSHNAFPQQPSAGNLYLPPTMAAPGVKLPFPMFKAGTNVPTPVGILSGYGGYGPMSMGYTASPTVTSGTSASNVDLAASQLKEQLSESPAVWIPPLGQDLTSLQVNSVYNLPQGQHVNFSPAQAGHGAFGVQQSVQAISGAPSAHPLLQQSQNGPVESMGLPPGAYQLPQHAQINWNTNF